MEWTAFPTEPLACSVRLPGHKLGDWLLKRMSNSPRRLSGFCVAFGLLAPSADARVAR